jgi:hypothetical protein
MNNAEATPSATFVGDDPDRVDRAKVGPPRPRLPPRHGHVGKATSEKEKEFLAPPKPGTGLQVWSRPYTKLWTGPGSGPPRFSGLISLIIHALTITYSLTMSGLIEKGVLYHKPTRNTNIVPHTTAIPFYFQEPKQGSRIDHGLQAAGYLLLYQGRAVWVTGIQHDNSDPGCYWVRREVQFLE